MFTQRSSQEPLRALIDAGRAANEGRNDDANRIIKAVCPGGHHAFVLEYHKAILRAEPGYLVQILSMADANASVISPTQTALLYLAAFSKGAREPDFLSRMVAHYSDYWEPATLGSRTTPSVREAIAGLKANILVMQPQKSEEIRRLVQELIDRPGYD